MNPRILESLTEHPVSEVRVGLHWTAVVVEKDNGPQCGLASTLKGGHKHTGVPAIPAPGTLEEKSSLELASWIESDIPLRRSVGCAAINALLPRSPDLWVEQNAEEAIRERGRGKRNVLVGHFPFSEGLRTELDDFAVLELDPKGEDFPISSAPDLLPKAELVAITGMTFINHTLPDLLNMCRPDATILLLGPSTPLSPILGEFGVDLLAGSSVEDIPAVMAAVGQGANFRQVHRAGVRLITQSTR
jgi:uncharacterized protein (DUF4213/DUF364 family)